MIRTPKTARGAALLALRDVERGAFPDPALAARGAVLGPRDRALARALVFGVLRWKSRLEWVMGHYLRKPEKTLDDMVRLILCMGLFQLDSLDRIPPSAAVNESVKLVKKYGPPSASGLVNAVLRSAIRGKARPDLNAEALPEPKRSALSTAHPVWMTRRWFRQLGREEAKALMTANNQPAPLTIRVRTHGMSREEALELLRPFAYRVELTTYAPDGLVLFSPFGSAADLPGFADGLFVVQDEAAQLVAWLARPPAGGWVLDACAGRGGKAWHLADLTETLVVAMEPDPYRFGLLANETRHLSFPRLRVLRGNLHDAPFPAGAFDAVLVDAPCSSLGVIRRRPDVKWAKRPQDPHRLAVEQRRLLAAAAPLVKPGGKLVYAVCTNTKEETRGVLDAFVEDHPDFRRESAEPLLPPPARVVVAEDGCLETWPHRHMTDGFFAAVLRREA